MKVWRAISALLVCVLLAACATPSPPRSPATHQSSPMDAVDSLIASVEGVYDQPAQIDRPAPPFHLAVRFQPVSNLDRDADRSNYRGLLLTQARSGENPRQFAVTLTFDSSGEFIRGRFAPLGAQGNELGSCPVSMAISRGGFVLETDPQTCRFGQGAGEMLLHKEMAFSNEQIVIADRLFQPGSNLPAQNDVVVRFLRRQTFQAQAAVLEGGNRRLSVPLGLDTSASPTAAVDAAGMSLGADLILRYYEMQDARQTVVLRLSVVDHASEEMLGEAWSEPGATVMGLNLRELEVVLNAR